jgi:hypothetical protein
MMKIKRLIQKHIIALTLLSEERNMKCDTIQRSCKRTSRCLAHSLLVITVLITMPGVANASVKYVPLWREVGEAELIVSGTIAAVRDEGTDKSVGTIAVLEVIKGDPALKTVEVRPGQLNRFDYPGVSKGQAGVWLLMKAEDKPVQPGVWRPTFVFSPKEFTPLVKMVAWGRKDDSVLALHTGWFDALDMEVIEYATSLELTGTTAIRTACQALSSPYWSCRAKAANWLAAVVKTPDDARTVLPALIVTASRIENINKGGNASARGTAYEAIRQILLRLGATKAGELPGWGAVVRGLDDSAEEAKRTEAEAAIRQACDLAQAFMQNPTTKQE